MKFTKNKSNNLDVYLHLQRVKSEFNPPLEITVDIYEYAKKINSKAQRIEVWNNDDLIGLIAFYINSTENLFFITNVSVEKKFQGKKIAQKLMIKVFEIAKEINHNKIILEVFNENKKAIEFYKKLNFEIKSNSNNYLKMEYFI